MDPPLPNCYKGNMDSLRIDQKKSITISYVCKDNIEKSLHLLGTTITDCSVLIAKTLMIYDAIRTATRMKLDTRESNSQVALSFS